MRGIEPGSLLIMVVLLAGGCGVSSAGTVTYIYTDPQGTPLAEVDANGTIEAIFDYRPYGSLSLGNSPDGPGYTGHVNDSDIGLVYMQARYYDPLSMRFLSIDPVHPTSGNQISFNRFSYANNNPLMFIDPDGREADQQEQQGQPPPPPQPPPPQPPQPPQQPPQPPPPQQQPQQQVLQYKPKIPQATGRLAELLNCVQQQCPGERITVTSTNEPIPQHPSNSAHGRSEAADLRVTPGHEQQVLQCASNCGAGYGQNERDHPSAHATAPHDHIQLGPGINGGRGDLPPPEANH